MNKVYIAGGCSYENSMSHHGIKGQKWGERRYQNEDGSLTEEGRKRYSSMGSARIQRSLNNIDKRAASALALRNEAAARAGKYARKGIKYANKHGDSEKTTKKLNKLDKKIKKEEDTISSLENLISEYDKATWNRVGAAIEGGYDVTIKKSTRSVVTGRNFLKSIGVGVASGVVSGLTGSPIIGMAQYQKVEGNKYKVRKNKYKAGPGTLTTIEGDKVRRWS